MHYLRPFLMSTFSLTLKFTQEFTGFVVYFIIFSTSTTPGRGYDRGRVRYFARKAQKFPKRLNILPKPDLNDFIP